MDRLQPIPTPPSQFLRGFCQRTLPVLTFAATATAVAVLWIQHFGNPIAPGGQSPSPAETASQRATEPRNLAADTEIRPPH
jgi:hypothetical protein